MSRTHQIELPEEVFAALLQLAASKGVSPADWIASQIPTGFLKKPERPLSEALKGIVGSVNSSTGDRPLGPFSAVSDLIVEKFRKQGFIIP